MSDRVVLAPDKAGDVPVSAHKTSDGLCLSYPTFGGCREHVIPLTAAEARHLRDLLCEWNGLPESLPGMTPCPVCKALVDDGHGCIRTNECLGATVERAARGRDRG